MADGGAAGVKPGIAGSPIGFDQMFEAEKEAIGAASGLEALCLSGGGVRSAAYSLGVLQALAEARQLGRFHYLSTVSGGGYIGAWLQVLLRRWGLEETQRRLAHGDPGLPGNQPLALRRLRSHTRWLTGNGGPASVDGWTGAAIYGRNVLLNWLVFAPIFLLCALFPVAARTTFYVLQGGPEIPLPVLASTPALTVAGVFALAGLVALVRGTVASCRGLPSRRPRGAGKPDYWSVGTVERRIVLPSVAWAFLLPPAMAPVWELIQRGPAAWAWAVPGVFALGSVGGYLLAAVDRPAGTPSYWGNLWPWCMASLIGAGMLRLGLSLADMLAWTDAAEVTAVAGPAWLLLCLTVVSAVHAGLRGASGAHSRSEADAFGDVDAEWMARISALRLRAALAWSALALCSLTLSHVFVMANWVGLFPVWLSALIAGPVAAWVGKQAWGEVGDLAIGKSTFHNWDLLLRAASLAFGAAVLAGSAVVAQQTLALLQAQVQAAGVPIVVSLLLCNAALVVGLLLLLTGIDGWVSSNRFSLHGVYRDRLVRAFIGPARPSSRDAARSEQARQADPFTEFDPGDNPPLAGLLGPAPQRLFPVINATLNLSAGRRPDWADRKAAPFTMTPLHCGAAYLAKYRGRYCKTAQYGGARPGGISLGTAMAVSGAAVSPNWGYHSSAITAFVMTLFNVRLGAWLPNTAQPASLRAPAGWRLLTDELLARTDDRRAFVYLSDGGHFDDLGLYEMLRRQCRLIVVVDANRDAAGTYRDLGSVLRMARIDMDMQIVFRDGLADAEMPGLGMGVIRYADGARGTLIVLKPSLAGGVPRDVLAYKADHDQFPHEPTSDQWFTEAQFESYRALGQFQAGRALARHDPAFAKRPTLQQRRDGWLGAP